MKNRPAPQACLAAAMLFAAVSTHAQGPKPVAAGEASIRGRVVERVGEKPVAGASIELIDSERNERMTVKTGDDGTYVLEKVASGDYQIVAAHPDFVMQVYDGGGARIPPMLLSVGSRDRLVGVDFVLTRAAQIRGQVTDAAGKPVARANVQVLRAQTATTSRPTQSILADENGFYRVTRLREGEYLVRVVVSATSLRVVDGRALLGPNEYKSTYYPGVEAVEDAQVIRLSTSEVADNVNLVLLRAEYFDISGHVATSGPLPDKVELVLTAVPSGAMHRQGRVAIGEDGAFVFSSMKPGRYVLWARATTADGVEIAHMPVDVDRTIDGIRLELAPAAKVSGRVVTERGDPLPPHGFRIAAVLMDHDKDIDPRQLDQVEVAVDGRFTLNGLFGDRVLRVFGLPPDWQVIRIDWGRTPIERLTVQPGLDIDDLVVVLGRR